MKRLAILCCVLPFVGSVYAVTPVASAAEAPKVAVAAQGGAKQGIMTAESSAAEATGADGVTQTVVNTAFAFTSRTNPLKKDMTEQVLLAQRIESSSIAGREGAVAKLETSAWVDGKGRYDEKMWTIYDCADGGWRDGDFYITAKYGQGGAEELLRAYNFANGKYVYSFTVKPVSAEIYIPKDLVKRYIAYASKKGSDSVCRKNETTREAIGAVTLSDGIGQMDRIVLESANDLLARSPSVVLVDKKEVKGVTNLMVWGPAEFANKSEVVKGFSLKLGFADGSEALIPVSNDKFDIERAALPNGMKARRIDIEK